MRIIFCDFWACVWPVWGGGYRCKLQFRFSETGELIQRKSPKIFDTIHEAIDEISIMMQNEIDLQL